jgi:hypothetical protein
MFDHFYRIWNVSRVVCDCPPPVPLMVMEYVPLVALLATDRLKFAEPEPGAAIDEGVKLDVTPDGTPVAENEMAELKPPETAVVTTA